MDVMFDTFLAPVIDATTLGLLGVVSSPYGPLDVRPHDSVVLNVPLELDRDTMLEFARADFDAAIDAVMQGKLSFNTKIDVPFTASGAAFCALPSGLTGTEIPPATATLHYDLAKLF